MLTEKNGLLHATGWRPMINGSSLPEIFDTQQEATDYAVQKAEREKIEMATIEVAWVEEPLADKREFLDALERYIGGLDAPGK